MRIETINEFALKLQRANIDIPKGISLVAVFEKEWPISQVVGQDFPETQNVLYQSSFGVPFILVKNSHIQTIREAVLKGEGKIATEIVARTSVEGIHRWAECPIEEVSYLRNYHRHIFRIAAKLPVTHSDRDTEFIQLTHKIKTYLKENYWSTEAQCCFFGDRSCEMIGEELLKVFNLSEIEVQEDEESSAIVRRVEE